ncbi:hypothetical protein [Methanobacterium sp.]|nr:hypothetical protein [Methanobacterium sp.]MBI5459618.1 hypothetical protein [Methanobacterium sp.]
MKVTDKHNQQNNKLELHRRYCPQNKPHYAYGWFSAGYEGFNSFAIATTG